MNTKKCPYCSEEILIDAKKCKHCGEYLDSELREKQKSANSTEKKIIVCLDTDTMRRTRESEPAFASQKQFTLKDGLSRRDIDHHYRDEKNRVVQTVITTFDYNK